MDTELNSASHIPFLWPRIVLTKIPYTISIINNCFYLVPATASFSLKEHLTKLMSSEATHTDLNLPYSKSHIFISPVKSAETNTCAVFLPKLIPAKASLWALYFLIISKLFFHISNCHTNILPSLDPVINLSKKKSQHVTKSLWPLSRDNFLSDIL